MTPVNLFATGHVYERYVYLTGRDVESVKNMEENGNNISDLV